MNGASASLAALGTLFYVLPAVLISFGLAVNNNAYADDLNHCIRFNTAGLCEDCDSYSQQMNIENTCGPNLLLYMCHQPGPQSVKPLIETPIQCYRHEDSSRAVFFHGFEHGSPSFRNAKKIWWIVCKPNDKPCNAIGEKWVKYADGKPDSKRAFDECCSGLGSLGSRKNKY